MTTTSLSGIAARLPALFAVLALWSCSSVDHPAPGVDAGCHQSFDAPRLFGDCSPTFDEADWMDQVCSYPSGVIRTQACDGYQLHSVELGIQGWTCVYDPVSLNLIAGTFVVDVPTFCGQTSHWITFGDMPPPGACAAPVLHDLPCNLEDAGSD